MISKANQPRPGRNLDRIKPVGDLVIGLDCSTGGTKAIAFDRKGKAVSCAQVAVPLFSPEPLSYEQDPKDWWISAQKALRAITRQVRPETIIALAVCNQRETFVPLADDGRCLRPAITWLDERCKSEVDSFSREIGKNTLHRITGKPADHAPVVYRLAWMKKREPHLFEQIGMICDVHTYMVWKLAGVFKTSWASADPLGLFDLQRRRWSPLVLSVLGLNEDQVPEAYRPGTILGKISEEASALTGLSTGTFVVAGGGDGQAAGLGANALTSGRAYLNLGTAVVAGVYGKRYRTSKAFRTMISCSESGYYYECSLRAGTFALDWFIRSVLKIDPSKESAIYTLLDREALEVSAGSDGLLYLPYLCGAMNPYWDMDARGAFVGLSSFHTRGHLYRSILEGIAFEQLFALGAVETSLQTRVKQLVTIGGGAASDVWCHILADITGKEICIPATAEASGLGAAIAAAVGVGWYRSFADAANEMTGIRNVLLPEPENHRAYQRLSAAYKRLYPSLKNVTSR
jgi:sugar (pentulose or hexulose) kinase